MCWLLITIYLVSNTCVTELRKDRHVEYNFSASLLDEGGSHPHHQHIRNGSKSPLDHPARFEYYKHYEENPRIYWGDKYEIESDIKSKF